MPDTSSGSARKSRSLLRPIIGVPSMKTAGAHGLPLRVIMTDLSKPLDTTRKPV